MLENHYGCELKARTNDTITIKFNNKIEKYDILATNEFTSERGMMSVIVRNQESQEIFNYAKGSDQAIRQRLDHIGDSERSMFSELTAYSRMGLRTLMFAQRKMDESELGNLKDIDQDEVE